MHVFVQVVPGSVPRYDELKYVLANGARPYTPHSLILMMMFFVGQQKLTSMNYKDRTLGSRTPFLQSVYYPARACSS